MIVSNDIIMNPPYDITSAILQLVSSISIQIGEINANLLDKQNPSLRKQNRIKTIYSSLAIEGNTLSTDQITSIIENKRVIGPMKDIQEVKNAISVYEILNDLEPSKPKDFLKAHRLLMQGLLVESGKYRTKGVGIVKGDQVQHFAPPHDLVPGLMKDLFRHVENKTELTLIKSCVFHYEMEFIHPFLDGNGRMGRLWQTLILMKEFPVFEFLPFETLIHGTQEQYYKALAASDKLGKSTPFIEYMLGVINETLQSLVQQNRQVIKDSDRIAVFLSSGIKEFTRLDYMNRFKTISSATASRDLKKALDQGLIIADGKLNKTKYRLKAE